jgi:hypothetical protein
MARPGYRRLPSEMELIRRSLLPEEEPEQAGRRQPGSQRGGLLVRAHLRRSSSSTDMASGWPAHPDPLHRLSLSCRALAEGSA